MSSVPQLDSPVPGAVNPPCPTTGTPEAMTPGDSGIKREADPKTSDTPVESHSPITALWLQSRLISSNPPVHRPHGEDRPFTVQNVRLASRLVGLFGTRFLAVFSKGQERRLMVYAIGKVIRGFLPTAR